MLRSLSSDININSWKKETYKAQEFNESVSSGESFIVENNNIYIIIFKGELLSIIDSDDFEIVKPNSIKEQFKDVKSLKVFIPVYPEFVKVIGLESLNYTEIESFYTENMPIEKIDEKLREKSFDGYIGISENTISGEHYMMYKDGNRSCITKNNSDYLNDEDSYERALSYAGIYTLYKSDFEYNRTLNDIISFSNKNIDNQSNSSNNKIEEDIDSLSEDDEDLDERILDSLEDKNDEEQDNEEQDDEKLNNSNENKNNEEQDNEEQDDGEQDNGEQDDEKLNNSNENKNNEESVEEIESNKSLNEDVHGDVLNAFEETSERLQSIDDKVIDNKKNISELNNTLYKIEDKLDNIESVINDKNQNILYGDKGTDFEENKTYKNKSPDSAIRNTKIKIQYPVNTRTLKQASENPEKSVSELIDSLHINTKPTFNKEKTLINGVEYDEFIQKTTVYKFTVWMLNKFYPALLEKESPNIDGVRDMVSRIEGVYNNANLKAGDVKSEAYNSIIYERDGTPTGVLDIYDEENTVSLNDIRETVNDIKPMSDRMSNTMNILILAKGTYDPGIRSDLGTMISNGGLLRNENRDALIKTEEGGEIHICLFEKYQDTYNLIYPDHKSM